MKTQIKLGIIGSGSIARTHAEAISRLPLAKLSAVWARNPANANELAAPVEARVFTDIDELLTWRELDAVLIATPSGAHGAMAVSALRAGKHVLCEKPLEITMSRVGDMIAEAERSGRILAGFFPLRYGAGARAIRRALDLGRFGRLTFLSARIKWWRSQEYYKGSSWRGTWELDGGGALMNQGIHGVDLLQWFGGPVKEAAAFGGTLTHEGLEVEDTLAASLRFEDGALGTIEACTSCYPGIDLSIEVSGDRGTAILVNDRLEYWQFAETTADDDAIREGRERRNVGGGASDPKGISCEGHRQQIAEFCRVILGQPATLVDGYEAAKAVSIIEAVYRSVNSGKSEPVFKW